MTSLSFPDVNVWLALLYEDHVHRATALTWWKSEAGDRIGFTRLTQMGVLRLVTTAAAMNGQPLTMAEAWQAYDRLFEDDRVVLYPNRPASKHSSGSFRKHRLRRSKYGPTLIWSPLHPVTTVSS